jgi:hypothetical protein
VAAALVFGFGFFAGLRWELPAVQRAQLALEVQHTADAQAVATANAQAAADLSATTQAEGAALSAHMAALTAVQSSAADERAKIATQAAQPGQDGPVAPVLSAAIASIQGDAK